MTEDTAIPLIILAFALVALFLLLKRPRRVRIRINLLRLAPHMPLCPSCTAQYEAQSVFCPHCSMPLSMGAVCGPLQSTFAEGEAFRRSVKNPKGLAVLGLVLLALPSIIAFLAWAHEYGPVDAAFMLPDAVLGFVFLAIIFRVLEARTKPPATQFSSEDPGA